jgi:hypothetical protein
MAEKTKFDQFTEELGRTAVLSQDFKDKLIQLCMSCMEDAFNRGLASAKNQDATMAGRKVRPTYSERKKELRALDIVELRNMAQMEYHGPDGRPLLRPEQTVGVKDRIVQTLLDFEVEQKWVLPPKEADHR